MPDTKPDERADDRAVSRRLFTFGCLALGVAAIAAGALALRHLGASTLPGCGLDSPCQRALSGPFGSLPWVDWPLAFAGTSYFSAMLAAWILGRAGWPRPLVGIARVGGLFSLALLVLAVQQDTLCPFCLAAQLGNLAFVLASERAPRIARVRRPELAFLMLLLGSTGLFAVARARAGTTRRSTDERELAESTRSIARGDVPRVFSGRYPIGPEKAAVRMLLFTDYQCEDCRRLEGEARALVAEHAVVSLSTKHFPLCKDCNRRARELGQNPHPNACWAARAAEAAGMVAGPEAFHAMSRWLFERGGTFVESDLRSVLSSLQLQPGLFFEALHGPETQARVLADVDEGLALGIQGTPMVFLNGVELRGWRAPDALRRAVEALLAVAPAPGGPESDRPPTALEKGLADWRLEPRRSLPARPGEDTGAALIVLWSDYLEPSTRELDRHLRTFIEDHPEVRYSFRHFPLDPECAPSVPASHPGACLAARAAEAARSLGGPSAFERFHAWLMEAPFPLDESRLREGARVTGLDPGALLATARGDAALAMVRADAEAARRLGVHSIPFLFLDGRRVPRWKLEGVDLLALLLEEALEESGSAPLGKQ